MSQNRWSEACQHFLMKDLSLVAKYLQIMNPRGYESINPELKQESTSANCKVSLKKRFL